LFISHAKIDGIPMALSLLGLMRRLQRYPAQSGSSGPDYFYDIEDIKPGDQWRKVLEDNASNSVLIALRTDEYEKRYWCRNEYLWAESSLMPVLVVDLRAGQYYDSARLPFDAAPVVKVHDGNLVRVILHALACDLRMLRYQVQLKDLKNGTQFILLPHKPSTYSMNGAAKSLSNASAAGKATQILYPNPALPDEFTESVQPLLGDAEMMSIDQFTGGL
jgi:hypothetical protein